MTFFTLFNIIHIFLDVPVYLTQNHSNTEPFDTSFGDHHPLIPNNSTSHICDLKHFINIITLIKLLFLFTFPTNLYHIKCIILFRLKIFNLEILYSIKYLAQILYAQFCGVFM